MSESTPDNNVPQWAKVPFSSFVNDFEQLIINVIISNMGGMVLITDQDFAVKRLTEMLTLLDIKLEDETREKIIDSAVKGESINIVYRQATIALWSLLESFVYDLLATWLENDADVFQNEAISKIKVPLGQYMAMSGDEKRYYLIDALKQNTSSPLKQGVTMFEVLLEPFGLKGSLDDEVKKYIFELSNTRNVIVHKRGIVDRRMVEACPWLKLKVGDLLIITPNKHHDFSLAVQLYVKAIHDRVKQHFHKKLQQI